jgi:hypothetical protein
MLLISQAEAKLTDGAHAFAFGKLKQLREGLGALRDIAPLTSSVDQVLAHRLVKDYPADSLTVPREEGTLFLNSLNGLRGLTQMLSHLLDSTLREESETTLAVLLPETDDPEMLAREIEPVTAFLTKLSSFHFISLLLVRNPSIKVSEP